MLEISGIDLKECSGRELVIRDRALQHFEELELFYILEGDVILPNKVAKFDSYVGML